ncbi:hypothetical protein N8216_00440 [Flavobacteriaceae bacterium]|nr:hypothetical protein [Flavobacteriaceae bacterium]
MFTKTTPLISHMVGVHDIVIIGDGISDGTIGATTTGVLTNTIHGTARFAIMDITTLDTITTAIITAIAITDTTIIEDVLCLTSMGAEV